MLERIENLENFQNSENADICPAKNNGPTIISFQFALLASIFFSIGLAMITWKKLTIVELFVRILVFEIGLWLIYGFIYLKCPRVYSYIPCIEGVSNSNDYHVIGQHRLIALAISTFIWGLVLLALNKISLGVFAPRRSARRSSPRRSARRQRPTSRRNY